MRGHRGKCQNSQPFACAENAQHRHDSEEYILRNFIVSWTLCFVLPYPTFLIRMIFLFVLYKILLGGNVIAAPASPLHPIYEISFYSRETNPNKLTQRSEWNIIFGCLATIFTCSWVVVHPNIPARSDSPMRIFLRRLMIMGYMLIVPEAVIFWAEKQWNAARYIAKKHKGAMGPLF